MNLLKILKKIMLKMKKKNKMKLKIKKKKSKMKDVNYEDLLTDTENND